ncbi:MAG: Rrf2 family transcriptional regulator [Gemmatimonadaceae bacterium]
MRITTQAEYGLICALHLARRVGEGPVTGREIASSERLPADYVEQIMLKLRRASIVTSTRGAHGGYQLARAPEAITVHDVISASEHSTFDVHCVTHPVEAERCAESHDCSIRPVWVLLQQKIDEVLQSVRLSDLLMQEREVRERVGLVKPMVSAAGRLALPVLQG